MSDASVDARVALLAAKLQAVVRGGFQPFGAESHGFRLNPPLTERQVESFEGRYGVVLPIEYRVFITSVANGQAGPAYGMFSLEECSRTSGASLFLTTFSAHPSRMLMPTIHMWIRRMKQSGSESRVEKNPKQRPNGDTVTKQGERSFCATKDADTCIS